MKKLCKGMLAIMIILLSLHSCTNDNDDKKKKQGRINTLLILLYGQTYQSPTIQFDAVYGVSEVLRGIYNNNISSTPVNVTVNCSVSGSLTVTGTYSVSSGVTTVDLAYTMNSCEFEQTNTYSGGTTATTHLKITGTINQTGTISSTQSYTKKLSGSSLSLNGTVKNSKYPYNSPYTLSGTCDYSYTYSSSGSTSTGSICGMSY